MALSITINETLKPLIAAHLNAGVNIHRGDSDSDTYYSPSSPTSWYLSPRQNLYASLTNKSKPNLKGSTHVTGLKGSMSALTCRFFSFLLLLFCFCFLFPSIPVKRTHSAAVTVQRLYLTNKGKTTHTHTHTHTFQITSQSSNVV